MKKNRLLILVVAASLGILLAIPFMSACGPAPAPEPKKTRFFMAGDPVVWGSYAITIGWANIVTKYSDIAIIVESKAGVEAIIEAVATGNSQIGKQGKYTDLAFAYLGEGKYDGKSWAPANNMRLLVGGLNFLTGSYVTLPRTGIKTIADLKGKLIPIRADAPTELQEHALLEAYGLDPENDVNWVVVSSSGDAWQEILMGRMDATWDVTNAELLGVQEDVGQIAWLPIEPEKLAQARTLNPEAFRGVYSHILTPGEIPGLDIPGPIPIIAFAQLAYANTDLPDYAAYTIVMTLAEHAEEVRAIAPGSRNFSLETVLLPADVVAEVPYHPGAIQAFEELGLWTPEHEKVQQALLG